MTLVAALIDTVNETATSMAEVHNARAAALNEKSPIPGGLEEAEIGTKAICFNQDIKAISKLLDLGKDLAVVLMQLEAIQSLKATYLLHANDEIDSRLEQASNATSSCSMM
ncbi:hypothetical protein D9M68_843810 [compost metagenome]